MSSLAFDTHKFVRELTKANMPEAQAEVLAQHYANLLSDRLATRDDLKIQDKTIDTRFDNFEDRMDDRFKNFEDCMDERFKNFEDRIDKRFINLEDRINARIINVALKTQIAGVIITCGIIGLMLQYS